MSKSKSNKSIRIAKDDVDNSDSDDQQEPMSKAHSPSTRERRRELLIVQNNLTFYGLYNAEFIDDMRASFDEDQTFSPGQKESLAKTPNDASLRKHILEPPCFEEFKIPSIKGAASSRQAAFERPLYDQAVQLRAILLPLTAAKMLLDANETDSASEILLHLLDKIRKDFQQTNLKRVFAITPDPEMRKLMKLAPDHALLDTDVIAIATASKKLAKTFSTLKSSPRRSDRRGDSYRRERTPQPEAPSEETPSAHRRTPDNARGARGAPRARGTPRKGAPRIRGL